jgi:hypothetical protein
VGGFARNQQVDWAAEMRASTLIKNDLKNETCGDARTQASMLRIS